MPQPATIDDAVAQIVASIRGRRLVVFCGAGISFNSGLPLANQLIEAILQRIDISGVPHQLLMPPRLPFEVFIETLRAESDVAPLLKLFALGEPNTNHMLLAKLAGVGLLSTVCTTNFDPLIETALESEGLHAPGDYRVLFREAELDSIRWDDANAAKLIKLHGSIADPDNMAITLRQVSHHQLSAHRQRVIEHLFSSGSHDDVLILGYSCSDVFDITPNIETLERKAKRILFVDHAPAGTVAGGGEVTDLSARSDRNPFRQFGGSLNLRCDTNSLMAAIWRGCLEEPYAARKSTVARALWEAYVDQWYAGLIEVPASRFNIAGLLLSRVSAWKDAERSFKLAVETAKAGGDEQNQASYLAGLGTAYSHLNDYSRAIACGRQGMELARKTGHLFNEATNAQTLANAYLWRGDLEPAYRYYRRAADIAATLDDKEGIAATLAALGVVSSCLDRHDEAIDNLRRAFSVASEDANLSEQVKTLGSLGDAHLRAQQIEDAKSCYRQSIELAGKIGLKEAEAKILGDLGIIHLTLNQYEQAIACLEQSRALATALHDVSGEGKVLGALGLCALKQGDYQRSIELDTEALRIGHEIGDVEMQVGAAIQLYLGYGLLGNSGPAARFLAHARNAAAGHPVLAKRVDETVRQSSPYLYLQPPPERPRLWRALSGLRRRPGGEDS